VVSLFVYEEAFIEISKLGAIRLNNAPEMIWVIISRSNLLIKIESPLRKLIAYYRTSKTYFYSLNICRA